MKPPSKGPTLQLLIRELGEPPSFKNHKLIAHGKLITDPKKQQWMFRATASLVSQLWCACRASEGGISMAARQRFLMRSLPHDDSWKEIPKLTVTVLQVPKGQEGADILVEPL